MIELPKIEGKLWTASELAKAAGVTSDLIYKQLRKEARRKPLHGVKIGQMWLIPDQEAQRFLKMERNRGRPKKVEQKAKAPNQ